MEELTQDQLEQARKAKREYMREYRKNPEVKKKMKQQVDRYWLKKATEEKVAELNFEVKNISKKEQSPVNISDLKIKEYRGQRVVTLKDIDEVHERREGTAKRNFTQNKNRLIEGEDYFKISVDEIRTHNIFEISPMARQDITVLTESGYLMLVKSFTDDLAWEVQRQLVKSYFRVKQLQTPKLPTTFAEALRLAADLEEEKQKLQSEKLMLEQQVAEFEPKITYLDTILDSTDSVVASQIAEDYGLTAQELNKILHNEEVQYKMNGQWLLYSQHKGKGYTESRTHKFTKTNGETGTSLHTRWTQKGRLFIHQILEKRDIHPLMDIDTEKDT
ncbi:phage antirepressor KilAC domain-containing protein [Bacillus badius]|uniref:Phage antirepressor protein n=1 Tax=Bacillus badius TaxID=1455 RepID=A0ABR5ANP1_BACBA|nr:phage antirepressor KilAC domain-containing protein [Bacillus badius]KIL72369.1 Phage antirepressor protein [Bacillus badius]MED4718270.1 phage antirepressor KilAC domain-containing protein [Bacillus badius]